MLKVLINGMIFCGAALMVYNIYGFVSFARFIRNQTSWKQNNFILYLPIALLVMFLLGYLFVGIFGDPDIVMGGILFGGSIFVFIMYKVLSNITGEILKNERLAAELRASEENDRVKTQFLASVSHEMRTPMNVIIGLTGICLKDQTLQTDTRKYLEKVDLSARHLLGLIKNVLDMNSIETGHFVIHSEVFSLREVLDQVNAIIGTLCGDKGLDYQVSIPETVNAMYKGDSIQIKNVVLSILDNAVKYTDKPGQVCFTVIIDPADGDKHLCSFIIADTGIGMDPDFLPHIFGAFSQEDSSSTNRYGGGGLSLAVAKNTLELMEGTIAVKSKKGEGSEFTVTVPLEFVAPIQQEKQQISLEGRRILVVEDIPENAEIVTDLLELEGVETEHAENGLIGLNMVKDADPGYYDAILMDLRMPVMDGLESARKIRALDRPDTKKMPIIAVTANAFESDVRATREAGMNAHLAKPTDADELYDTLREQLRLAEE